MESVLDSRINDIEVGHQRLFKEFQERVVKHDKTTFCLYKKKLVSMWKGPSKTNSQAIFQQVVNNKFQEPVQKKDVVQPEINPAHGGMPTNPTVRAPVECQKDSNATDCSDHVPLVIDDPRI